MTRPLRVLLIEDSERDAALLQLYLRRGGYEATLQRVENQEAMRTQLNASEWDVVISDCNLPSFNAHAALSLLKESGRKIPFLVLSGGIAPDAVDQILKAGATHFVLKNEMAKIASIIEKTVHAG